MEGVSPAFASPPAYLFVVSALFRGAAREAAFFLAWALGVVFPFPFVADEFASYAVVVLYAGACPEIIDRECGEHGPGSVAAWDVGRDWIGGPTSRVYLEDIASFEALQYVAWIAGIGAFAEFSGIESLSPSSRGRVLEFFNRELFAGSCHGGI